MQSPRPGPLPLLIAVAACSAAAPALAQAPAAADWALRSTPALLHRAMAFDPVRRQVIVHGGNDTNGLTRGETWFWNGTRWLGALSSVSPRPLSRHAMVTDTVRGEVVLFGAPDLARGETWIWNGSNWSERTTAVRPPGRFAHAMAYDAARARVVLHGGIAATSSLADTWEWDGAAWTQRMPANSPGVRYEHALAHDPARQRTVLFGGIGFAGATADTWEWDGVDWTLRTPTTSPMGRRHPSMTWDERLQRVVLFGGEEAASGFVIADTWEWDGTSWLRHGGLNTPASVRGGIAYDAAAGRVVLSGFNSTMQRQETWLRDGQVWTRVEETVPESRYGAGLVFEPLSGTALLYGGAGPTTTDLTSTWQWNGETWLERITGQSPGARVEPGMAHDVLRSVTVLFGGSGTVGGLLGGTWEWDGTDWAPILVSSAPTERARPSMAFMPSIARIVLFGGVDASGARDDTWVFDGANWTGVTPPVRPSARGGAALAFDPTGGGLLLFGGGGDPGTPGVTPIALADTWRFTGTAWQLLQPAASPPARWSAGVAADSSRGVIVLHGGYDGGPPAGPVGVHADTWEWDGANWTHMMPSRTPAVRNGPAMGYDLFRREVVLFGGIAYDYTDETWTYGARGEHAVYGSGCSGSLGVPQLVPSAGSQPSPGGAIEAQVRNVPGTVAVLALQLAGPLAAVPAAGVSLAPLGMPGCDAWLAPTALLPLPVQNGVATWRVLVPWTSLFNQTQLFHQALVLDPPANAAGLAVSNAARARIGN